MHRGPKGWMGLAALALGNAGCATTELSPRGQSVELATTAAPNCRFLGTVSGAEGGNFQSPQVNMFAVQAELRNRAGELGANVVVPTAQQLGRPGSSDVVANIFNQGPGCPNCITMTASAYACPNKPGSESSEQRRFTDAEPPPGAAGFRFGADVATASRQCTEAGNAWDSLEGELHTCSGTPVDTGMATKARIRFCDGKLCRVTLVVSRPGSGTWADQFLAVQETLKKKYGAPTGKGVTIPDRCAGATRPCFEDGSARVRVKWSWQAGQSVELVFGGPDGVPEIAVFYSSGTPLKKGAVNPGAL